MTDSSTDDTERPALDDMAHSELREEWENVVEQIRHGHAEDVEGVGLLERRYQLWQEMAHRTDAEPPKCPKCNERAGWSQTMGGPKYCNACDFAPGLDHEDLISAVDEYWNTVLSPTETDRTGGGSNE
jgi:hypothetical protein